MPDMRNRLNECFRAVFPDLPEEEILAASLDRTATWDSLASVKLIAVIEDELGFEFRSGITRR